MTDQWTDRLSEYLDGDLPAETRASLDAHLSGCAECTATLADLRRVVARAHALDDRPVADHWPAIAALIGSEVTPLASRRRRISFSLPQLAAAAIALMLLSSGLASWLVRRSAVRHPTPVAIQPGATIIPAGRTTSEPGSLAFDSAVSRLRGVLDRGRGRLDTSTVRVLEQSLQRIDRAIAEAQSAVAADPANVYLNGHLAETRMRKLQLLRRAAALATAAS